MLIDKLYYRTVMLKYTCRVTVTPIFTHYILCRWFQDDRAAILFYNFVCLPQAVATNDKIYKVREAEIASILCPRLGAE